MAFLQWLCYNFKAIVVKPPWITVCLLEEAFFREKGNLSAACETAQEEDRLSCPFGLAVGAQDPAQQKAQGPQVPDHGVTLKKGWEFDLVFRTGLRVQGELVRLLFLRTPGGGLRVGYAVGKRQGRAHVRVRGRRILREAFRRLSPWVVPDVALVLSLRERGLASDARRVFKDMAALFRRRGLLTDAWEAPDDADWNAPIGRDA